MKKGSKLKQTKEWHQTLYEGVCSFFKHRHESKESWDRAWFYVSTYMKERRQFYAYLEELPKRFGKNYGRYEYTKDVKNVLDYYTQWEREDFWQSKKSLKRLRQYEKREGLEPFEKKLEEERKEAQRIKDQEKELEYYNASKNIDLTV